MKGFQRDNPWFSLCGLNCGLCPLHFSRHCPGCGGGEGNQSCKIAKCSLAHGGIDYCFQCGEYPCETCENIDKFDSFITHQRQKADLEKAQAIGMDAYSHEQREKLAILEHFLSNYNDGRRKTFFFTAVNLLDLQDLKTALREISQIPGFGNLPLKEQGGYAAGLLREAAKAKNIELKLRKKK